MIKGHLSKAERLSVLPFLYLHTGFNDIWLYHSYILHSKFFLKFNRQDWHSAFPNRISQYQDKSSTSPSTPCAERGCGLCNGLIKTFPVLKASPIASAKLSFGVSQGIGTEPNEGTMQRKFCFRNCRTASYLSRYITTQSARWNNACLMIWSYQ